MSYGYAYNLRIVQHTEEGIIELGRISYDDYGLGRLNDDTTGIDNCEQVLDIGDRLYFVIAWYIGDMGEPFDEAVLCVTKGKADSLEVVSKGIGEEEKLMYICEENGEIRFTEHRVGSVGLDRGTYGDLNYYDSPDHHITLIKDHTPKEPYGFDAHLERNEEIPLQQSAEYVNGAAYIINADGRYHPVSYVDGFDLEDMTWMRIKDGKTETLAEISVKERRARACAEYEKLLTKYKEAAECYTKSLEINEFQAHTYFRRAMAYYEIQEYEKSMNDLNNALNLGMPVEDCKVLQEKLTKKFGLNM